MKWLTQLFGGRRTAPELSLPYPRPESGDAFPQKFLARSALIIIRYEGETDADLQRRVIQRLTPLAQRACVFKAYGYAAMPLLHSGEPACGILQLDEGLPRLGVARESYMAYLGIKPSLPHEYALDHIGYWVGMEHARKVHATLLLD